MGRGHSDATTVCKWRPKTFTEIISVSIRKGNFANLDNFDIDMSVGENLVLKLLVKFV